MLKNPHLCLVYLALLLIQVLNVIDVAFTNTVDMTTVLLSFLHRIWSVFPDLVISPATFLLMNVVWLCLMISIAPFLIIGKRWAGNLVIIVAIYQVMIGLYHFGSSMLMNVELQGMFSGIAQGLLGLLLVLEVFGYVITRKTA